MGYKLNIVALSLLSQERDIGAQCSCGYDALLLLVLGDKPTHLGDVDLVIVDDVTTPLLLDIIVGTMTTGRGCLWYCADYNHDGDELKHSCLGKMSPHFKLGSVQGVVHTQPPR